MIKIVLKRILLTISLQNKHKEERLDRAIYIA